MDKIESNSAIVTQINNTIKKLITADFIDCDINDDLCQLKMLLFDIKLIPYDPINKQDFDLNNYYGLIMQLNPKCENISNILDNRLCQTYGGDLFTHCQWSVLQIIKWFENKNILTEDLNIDEMILCAFFHSIGKYYSKKKYSKISYDIILGKKMINNLNINKILSNYFPQIKIKHIALTACMINQIKFFFYDELNFKLLSKKYIDKFKKFCHLLNIEPTVYLLKLCIVTSCAKISATTNKHIIKSNGQFRMKDLYKNDKYNDITVANQIYPSFNYWKLYNLDDKYQKYYNHLIDIFNSVTKN